MKHVNSRLYVLGGNREAANPQFGCEVIPDQCRTDEAFMPICTDPRSLRPELRHQRSISIIATDSVSAEGEQQDHAESERNIFG